MPPERPRPFFIVGAQKGGTTALFEYLRRHPDVYMPPEKEIEFFSGPERDARAWEVYRRRHLAPGRPVRAVGTASPQYMCDTAVPARMAARVPRARLIAVLRDPVERAVSHYKMARRRGTERRSFAEAVRAQLAPGALERLRALPFSEVAERDAYVAWGEYARILRGYLEHFPREQLLVLFSEDLREHGAETLRRVYRHLGIAEDFTPPNLGRRYHVGGARRRIPGLEKLLRSFAARGLLRLAMPKRSYKRMLLSIERWNARPGALAVPVETYRALVAHYAPERAELARLAGGSPRWFGRRGTEVVML